MLNFDGLLKSRKMIVNAEDNSFTKLAGSVKDLTVYLSDSAKLDAKFLRAKTVHVVTEDNSHASIYAINYLFAETSGPSRIDYFGLPKIIKCLQRSCFIFCRDS